MFTDMVDFSALTQRDERLALQTIDEYQRLLRPLFGHHRGREVKALGDGFLVEFDSALDAAECAVEIQRRLFERNQASGAQVAEMRIGIHLGDVVQRDGDIYGDAVNVASRIEPLAEASGICISGPVLEQVGNKIPYRCVQLDYGFLKNISTPITVYSVDLPWHAPPAARLTPMTDRTSELGLLQESLRAAARGEGGVVAISGESGIGKTRLAEEIIHRAEKTGFRVLRGRRFEEELNAPYSHWVQAARAFVRDAPPPLIYKVCDKCGPEAVALVPELAEQLGPLPPTPKLEGSAARLRFFEGVGRFFQNIAAEAPLLLLLDDFQWADADSVSLLEHFGSQLQKHRVLVLVTYRDTEVDTKSLLAKALFNLRKDRALREVSLKRFDPVNSRALVGAVLGGEAPPTDIVQPVLEKTGGNPLFVEEICRSLIEDRSLVRTTHGWQAKPDTKIAIPSTVKEVIRRRIDWIGPEAENVLAIASVFGNEFEFDLLQQLSEVEPDRLLLLVEAMLRARLLREGEIAPGRSMYQFGDEQTRDVLYDGLSLVRRRRLHLKAAQALERALGDRTAERASELAYHFLQGNDPRRAIDYYEKAGERARTLYAQEEAVTGFSTALTLIEGEVARDAGQLDLCLRGTFVAERLGDAQHYVGRQKEAAAAYIRGAKLSTACDAVTQGHMWCLVANAHNAAHDYDASLEALDTAEAALGTSPPTLESDRWWKEWTFAQTERMSVYYWRDDPDRMAEFIAKFRPVLEKSPRPQDRAQLYNSLVLLDWRRHHGISDEGLEYTRLAYQANLQTGDPESVAWTNFMMGFSHFWHGDPHEAKQYLATAIREGERMNSSHLISRATTYLMASARRAGDLEEARRLIPRVFTAAETAGHPEYSAMAYSTECWTEWHAGHFDKAVESGHRALKIWREIPNRYPCDWMAIWPLVAIALDRNDVPGAIELSRGLLPKSQSPLPPELDTLVRKSIASEETGETAAAGAILAQALGVARRLGYI
jgi:tetratricopeptide (TPR) repeat protein